MVTFSSTSQSTFSMEAVMASMVLMARMMTMYSKTRALFFMPTDLKSGTTVKYCHTFLSSPALANSSLRMASDSRTASSLSRVMAPRHLTPSPGPGKGWRYTISCGRPSSMPQARTSSLKSCFNGSTSSNLRSSGSPPTLWWDFTILAVFVPLSMISG